MDYKRLIRLASSAGQIILENGGETYRVEETITKIIDSYDAHVSESFVTPTGIMVSLTCPDGEIISLITRVRDISINLEKVSLINDLSRKVSFGKTTLDQLDNELHQINSTRMYSLRTQFIFSAVIAASFTLLYGGVGLEGIAAGIIAPGVRVIQHYSRKLRLNGIFINIIGGAYAAILSALLVRVGLGNDHNIIILGSVMIMVPGIAITNAIRDTLFGDYLSGLARGLEAILVALGIAVGVGLGLRLMGGL